jgi:peptidoglycan/xylan/chitin deacetylase (PgdA/CDA1 family)
MRRKLKKIALALGRAISPDLEARLATVFGGRGAILLMHRVVRRKSDTAAADLTVTTTFLAEALAFMRAAGMEFVTLGELGRRLAEGETVSRRAVALTFDDGYRDNLTLALPILRRFWAPATIFVPSGAPDRTMDAWFLRIEKAVALCEALRPGHVELPAVLPCRSTEEKRAAYQALVRWIHRDIARNRILADNLLPKSVISDEALLAEHFASWGEIREAAEDPLLSFGGHSVSHPVLSSLSASDAFAEMAKGRERLEAELQRPIPHFAYPYGGPAACGAREFALAERAGYALAVTTRYDCVLPRHKEALLALPRITLGGREESLDALACDLALRTA